MHAIAIAAAQLVEGIADDVCAKPAKKYKYAQNVKHGQDGQKAGLKGSPGTKDLIRTERRVKPELVGLRVLTRTST